MSIAELRAALDGVAGLAVEARGHALLAAERLAEATGILTELAALSAVELPAEALVKAREEVEEAAAALTAAGELVGDLGNRL